MKIILRAVELKDIDLIYSFENDTAAWADGINTRFLSRYAIEQYVLTIQNEDIFSSQQIRLMIDIKTANGNKTVGCADLYDIDYKHSKAGVGIYINKEDRGNHYSPQTIHLLSDYAFNTLNLHQLYAFVREDNLISNFLFSSCGYKKTALLRDWLKLSGQYKNVNVYQLIH